MTPSPHRSVVEKIVAGRNDEALTELKSKLGALENAAGPEALSHYVFGAALARRLSTDTADECNLYLDSFDVPQIHLFNLLANEVPIVSLTTGLANGMLASSLDRTGPGAPTVIDVGTGTGRQIEVLIQALAASDDPPEALTVIGIEPSAWSLELAEQNVLKAAAAAGISVDFHAFCAVAEGLSMDDWRAIAAACTSRPAVNASFALHHISDDAEGRDLRTQVLKLLRTLDPTAVVLAEPNVHHFEDDLLQRFDNCWEHFSAVFGVIDALDLEERDQNALKVCFFGREIHDILGNPDGQRTERHERTTSWLGRLAEAGYRLHSEFSLPDSQGPVSITQHDGWVSLDKEDEALVAMIGACPIGPALRLEDVGVGVTRPRPVTPPALDARAYLSALISLARADGSVHERERAFIERQARILGIELASVPELQTQVHTDLDGRTRDALLRDLIFLARVDGDYSDSERELIRGFADTLGFDDAHVKALEARSNVAPALSATPSWFQEYWFLSNKS